MKELIAKLEAATEGEQERLILEALDVAHRHNWINPATYTKAWGWAAAGHYLSAAMVMVPEGWMVRKFEQWPDGWYCSIVKSSAAHQGNQKPPALAITIAAMRAWEEIERNGG